VQKSKLVVEDHVPAPSKMVSKLDKMEFDWEKMVDSNSNLNGWKNSQKKSRRIIIMEVILSIFYAATKIFLLKS
jgi:hypothetical protein